MKKKKQIIWGHQFHSALFNKCLLTTYCVHDKYLCLSLPSIANNHSVKFSDLPGIYLLSVQFSICAYIITIESYTI